MHIINFIFKLGVELCRVNECEGSSPFATDKKPSSSATNTTPSLKLIVHFEYGDQKFAKRISVDVINKFYEDVVFILHKRNPGYIPSCLQIQCGSCWYNFTEDTEFDDLCLTDSSPELSIRAVPTPTDLGNILYL